MTEKERKKKEKQLKKWREYERQKKPLTKKGFEKFIDYSLDNRENITIRVNIGDINDKAKHRINDVCGDKISFIDINNNGIVHAVTKAGHHVKPYDLLAVGKIINSSKDITLSDKKHRSNKVLQFNYNNDEEMTVLAEIHPKKNYLLFFNAWWKKAKRGSDAT